MSRDVHISGACLNLPKDFKESEDALSVLHERPDGEPDVYSLSIGNNEMWIRGDRDSLNSLVDSLLRRLIHLNDDSGD